MTGDLWFVSLFLIVYSRQIKPKEYDNPILILANLYYQTVSFRFRKLRVMW